MYEQVGGSNNVRRRPYRRLLGLTGAALAFTACLVPSAVAGDEVIPEDVVEPRNVGGGQTMGTIQYTGQPLPKVLAACRPTTFSFTAASHAFAFNTVVAGFVGPVTIQGSGSSGCESASVGPGTMTLTLTGRNETTKNTLRCPTLVGGYTRALSDMTLILSGNCVVNNFGQGIVNFVARLQVVPKDSTAGFLEPVTAADTWGVFAIAPA